MAYHILLIAGLIFLLISFYYLNKSVQFIKRSEKTTGTVANIIRNSDSDGDTYIPVFEFTTHNKEKITFQRKFASSPVAWSLGEKATILYNPDNPQEAKAATYFNLFGTGVVLLCIAAPLLILGIGNLLAQRFLTALQ